MSRVQHPQQEQVAVVCEDEHGLVGVDEDEDEDEDGDGDGDEDGDGDAGVDEGVSAGVADAAKLTEEPALPCRGGKDQVQS